MNLPSLTDAIIQRQKRNTPENKPSSSGGSQITKRVMNSYRTRLQIEEAFGDVKNSRWSFSLEEARSSSTYRYENLLLFERLAKVAVWLVGKVAKSKLNRNSDIVIIRRIPLNLGMYCPRFTLAQVFRKTAASFRWQEYQQAIHATRQ
jgi:hypothetical protein